MSLHCEGCGRMWSSEKDQFCAGCGSPRDWREEDPLSIIEVAEEAIQAAREKSTFAKDVQWQACIRAILDGYPVKVIADKAGFAEPIPPPPGVQMVTFEDEEDPLAQMQQMFYQQVTGGRRSPNHPEQSAAAQRQFATWLCNELYRYITGVRR